MGDPVHLHFDRDRDLLFSLLGRSARPLGDDLHPVVRHVGVGFDGQRLKRNNAPPEQQDPECQDQELLPQGKVDDALNQCGRFTAVGSWRRRGQSASSTVRRPRVANGRGFMEKQRIPDGSLYRRWATEEI